MPGGLVGMPHRQFVRRFLQGVVARAGGRFDASARRSRISEEKTGDTPVLINRPGVMRGGGQDGRLLTRNKARKRRVDIGNGLQGQRWRFGLQLGQRKRQIGFAKRLPPPSR